MAGKNDDAAKSLPVSINIPAELVSGTYANTVQFVVNDSEAIIDFAFIPPQTGGEKQGTLVSRIIIKQEFAEKIATSIIDTMVAHAKRQKKS